MIIYLTNLHWPAKNQEEIKKEKLEVEVKDITNQMYHVLHAWISVIFLLMLHYIYKLLTLELFQPK
jgi:hypothetical protein